ncbi:MAG: methyltransferase [Deltaproteobacteria bacterium]|nr:methyltransferase [Deltaproteobacteria bacterium]
MPAARRAISSDDVAATLHRLFIGREGTSLRKEDLQKVRELVGLLTRLATLRKGAHLVDAAAGKASVGLVAAELLPIGRLTVLERDPGRVEACRAATERLRSRIEVDIRLADVAETSAWPVEADAVVALHACGPAADAVLESAVHARARQLFVAPCCYGKNVSFLEGAKAAVTRMGLGADDLLLRRMAASVVDLERTLRLEAAGYEAHLEEFVGATVTPHNLLFLARRTCSDVRIARARDRLAALRASASYG